MDSTATIFDPNRFSEKATNSRLTQVWTALPGIIQKFDAGALTCEVQPAIKGRVTQEDGRLVIELHIAVSYGLNISTAARSISHRVKDEVEQATGLKVARVVVSVDDVIA